ncbi:AAA family ATPase [Bacillus velezensis]|nr:AAA family ATPase [Bacillus velezensis]
MKITAMHIYQYGKFSDRSFQLSDSPVQVIYGLNEAGKTTLMSFIKSVLFGFPKSKNTNRKRRGLRRHCGIEAWRSRRCQNRTDKGAAEKSECIRLQAKSRTENGSNSFSPIQTGRCTKRSIRSMYSTAGDSSF